MLTRLPYSPEHLFGLPRRDHPFQEIALVLQCLASQMRSRTGRRSRARLSARWIFSGMLTKTTIRTPRLVSLERMASRCTTLLVKRESKVDRQFCIVILGGTVCKI